MQANEEYLKKLRENREVLKRLNVYTDSWDGAEKKELQLKLKECSHLLKDWNVSSVDHVPLVFARQFMDKIQSFEKQANMEMKINSSQKLLRGIEDEAEYMERTAGYNESVLDSVQGTSLSDALQSLSLDSTEAVILENGPLTLPHERINVLLKKIKEQEAEIKKLSSLLTKI